MNKICHGFRLKQIDAAMQKRTSSEFAWECLAGAELPSAVDDEVEHGIAAMGRDLYHVLAGVCAWPRQIPRHCPVDGTVQVIDNFSMGYVAGPTTEPWARMKQASADGQRLVTAESHHADAAATTGSTDGDNCRRIAIEHGQKPVV
jgi:hypothetical protein